MVVVLPFLAVAFLAAIGMGIFFWRQIAAERKAEGACAACRKPVFAATRRYCVKCRAVVCSECTSAPAACPKCGSTVVAAP